MATTELDILKQTIDRSNEQGQVISKIVTEMQELKTEMESLYGEVKEEFEKFKETIPLSGPEADRLQSFAYKKAHQFTEEFFGKKVSQELYMKKFGHLISGVYRQVKNKYGVSKYTQVKHMNAEDAITFVQSLELKDLPSNYLRLTDSQEETALKHSDNLSKCFPRG